MKDPNKLIILLVCCCLQALSPVKAQVAFHAYAKTSYHEVSSYLGKEGPVDGTVFQFDVPNANTNLKNWSLSVRLISPIQIVDGGPSKSGKLFPLNKISFRWTIDNGNQHMNLQNFGVNFNDIILQEGNEIMLIDQPRAALHGRGQSPIQVLLYGTIKIASGKYLDEYQSAISQWAHIKYRIPLLYTFYDEQRRVISTRQIEYQVQILPRLSDGNLVDVEPEYSLQLGADAANATLRFMHAKHYTDGVAISLDNAVKINAKTNFELRVKAVDAELSRNGGGALPLSALSTQLTAGSGARPIISNPVLTLTTNEQVLLSGSSVDKKEAQYFNLHYKAKLTPAQVLSVKPGDYSLSLLYLLLPK